jgi:alpha-L-fucosidase
MKRRQLLAMSSALPLAHLASGLEASPAGMTGAHAIDARSASTEIEDEQRTAWYRQAKFGMFVHWGPYSVASVEASWPIMRPSKEFSHHGAGVSILPGAIQSHSF